jgi:hypothetical protein
MSCFQQRSHSEQVVCFRLGHASQCSRPRRTGNTSADVASRNSADISMSTACVILGGLDVLPVCVTSKQNGENASSNHATFFCDAADMRFPGRSRATARRNHLAARRNLTALVLLDGWGVGVWGCGGVNQKNKKTAACQLLGLPAAFTLTCCCCCCCLHACWLPAARQAGSDRVWPREVAGVGCCCCCE